MLVHANPTAAMPHERTLRAPVRTRTLRLTIDCFVTRAALTEVVYTLESYYRSARVDVGRALDALLSLQRIAVEDRAVTEWAVSWFLILMPSRALGRAARRRAPPCRSHRGDRGGELPP